MSDKPTDPNSGYHHWCRVREADLLAELAAEKAENERLHRIEAAALALVNRVEEKWAIEADDDFVGSLLTVLGGPAAVAALGESTDTKGSDSS